MILKGIPECCAVNQHISKTQFVAGGKLERSDKSFFEKEVNSIRLTHQMKQKELNVSPYSDRERRYDELLCLRVELKPRKRTQHQERVALTRLTEIFVKAIPKPILLQLSRENQVALAAAHRRYKRDSTQGELEEDPHESIPERILLTEAKSKEHIAQLATRYHFCMPELYPAHLYALYTSFFEALWRIQAALLGADPNKIETQAPSWEELERLEGITRKIASLRKRLKDTACGPAEKIELNAKIKQLEKKR